MEIKILPIDPEEKSLVYSYTKTWFFPSEPLTMSWTEVPSEDAVSYIKALDQRLSLKAVDQIGIIAAICINCDDSKLIKTPVNNLPSNLYEVIFKINISNKMKLKQII